MPDARHNKLAAESVYDRGYNYPSEEEIKMIFVSSCIESVAARLGQDPASIYKRMSAVGMIHDYILKHYDVIHSESRENITDDMTDVLMRWEKKGGRNNA